MYDCLVAFALCCVGVQLLATASRDRLVHIFDIDHDYGLVQTLDDHSSAITAVRFTELDGQLMMLSCGADKSLLFRNAQLVCYVSFCCPLCLSCILNNHMWPTLCRVLCKTVT